MSEQIRSGQVTGNAGRLRAGSRYWYGRRAVLLGAAAAGAGAGFAGGRPAQARPLSNGSMLELGEVNNTSATTWIKTSSGSGLAGQTATADASGVAGIDSGTTGTGTGIYGHSATGHGVYGTSATGNGVYGTSPSGYGVYGTSASGYGMYGAGHIGVAGNSTFGVGVSASSKASIALDVDGRARFTTSNVAMVEKGSKTVTVTAPWITDSSVVLATIQKPQGGIYIEAAEPGSGSFKISLNKAATADLPVGWFVIG